jgi:hypothetical protein
MVKVANKWFAAKKIPNVKFFNVKDADDELEWLVQIGEQGVAEGIKFRSKQECIDHFVRTGRSAAQGAAAWERMSSQLPVPKAVKPYDPKQHGEHWWQKDESITEMGGVGVVRGGNDPRYSMSTAGDQNGVTGNTLGQEMQALGLVGRKNPGANSVQRPVKRSVDRGN